MSPSSSTVPVAPAGRPTAFGDAPDIMYVIRRHLWLIILGTVAGFIVGLGLFVVLRRTSPSYTAGAQFQVMSIANPLELGTTSGPGSMTAEDITRFIRTQGVRVKSDSVLDKALRNEKVHDTVWFRTYQARAKQALREQIDVSPVAGTEVFAISMKGRIPDEIAAMVNAIAQTYMDELQNDTRTLQSKALENLKSARTQLQEQITLESSGLDDFRNAHDISAITNAHTIALTTFSSLSAELMKAQTDLAIARANYDMIKRQVESNTLQLPAEMEQYVENDPVIRSLSQSILGLEQERVAAMLTTGPQGKTIQIIDARMEEIRRQIADERDRLTAQTKLRMQESAQTVRDGAEKHEQDVRDRLQRKDRELKDMDTHLVEYRARSAHLDSQRQLLDEITRRLTLEQLKTVADSTRVRLFQEAKAPDSNEPSFPDMKMFLPLGTLVGLALAFFMAYVRELTNTRVRTPLDITRAMQLPLLGFVPDQQDDEFVNGDLSTSIRTSPTSMIAESFRQIRGRLTAQTDGQPLRTLLVASIAPGGGATTVASNLANGIALNGQRVLLVDANFYRPGLKNCYKNIPATGLSDILAGAGRLEDSIVPSSEMPSLHVMGTGSSTAGSASQLLEGRAFRDLLTTLEERYDVVIFDGAPLSLVADSISLGAKVDGVIGVVRAGMISRGTVVRVRDQLKLVKANLVGIVLNAARTHGAGYFKENYRNFYRYAGPATPSTRQAPPTAPTPN